MFAQSLLERWNGIMITCIWRKHMKWERETESVFAKRTQINQYIFHLHCALHNNCDCHCDMFCPKSSPTVMCAGCGENNFERILMAVHRMFSTMLTRRRFGRDLDAIHKRSNYANVKYVCIIHNLLLLLHICMVHAFNKTIAYSIIRWHNFDDLWPLN